VADEDVGMPWKNRRERGGGRFGCSNDDEIGQSSPQSFHVCLMISPQAGLDHRAQSAVEPQDDLSLNGLMNAES
jgi:hypothetical protein